MSGNREPVLLKRPRDWWKQAKVKGAIIYISLMKMTDLFMHYVECQNRALINNKVTLRGRDGNRGLEHLQGLFFQSFP
jgi:hypothetical protein